MPRPRPLAPPIPPAASMAQRSWAPAFCRRPLFNLPALLIDLLFHLRIDHVPPFAQRIILGGRVANPLGRRQLHPHQPTLHIAIKRLCLAIELFEHRISIRPKRTWSRKHRSSENDSQLPSHLLKLVRMHRHLPIEDSLLADLPLLKIV